MSDAGKRIIESLKQALACDFARVTIDGQTWVRLDKEHAIVPIKPNDAMLEELARIGDGPDISGEEVWGYMLAAAAGADFDDGDRIRKDNP